MSSALIRYIFLPFLCFGLFSQKVLANVNVDQKDIEVSLRMIGHQVLLAAGDSSSRVLPIELEQDKGIIRFDTEFSFNPDDLQGSVDSIFSVAGFKADYVLEVEDCESEEIIYSYKVSQTEQSDIVPCRSRDQPESCYNIIVSFSSITPSPATSNMEFYLICIVVLIIMVLLLLRFVRKKSGIKHHWLSLGKYHFDHRNSTLILKEQRTDLTSKESDLLLLLYNEVNTTVNRDEILNKVWGDEGDYIGRTLDVFISKLRKKLEADPGIKIVNVRGVGYKLVVDE